MNSAPDKQRNPGRFGVEHRAGAQQDSVAQPLGHLLQHPVGLRDGERDFHDVDAAGHQGFGHVGQQLAAGRRESRPRCQ